MPHKKKKFLVKGKCEKFLVLSGKSGAVNADGEALPNVFAPVSKNYKSGTSLICSAFTNLCNPVENGGPSGELDLEEIIDQFGDDSETEDDEIGNIPNKMKHLTVKENKQKSQLSEDKDDECSDDFYDDDSQFSDATEDSLDNLKHTAELDYANCPENLKILNERFEKVLEEYDEDQIGALDEEEICGHLSTDCERIQHLLDEESLHTKEETIVLGQCDQTIKERILNYVEDSGDENIIEIVTKKPVQFDCESILSTYSNIYNHPSVIKEEKVTKIRIPNNPLKKKLTKSQLKMLESEEESDTDSGDNLSVDTRCNVRVKGETPEERRERKSVFKEAKRESRIFKKENKLAFKKEKKIQKAQNINKQQNTGIKLL